MSSQRSSLMTLPMEIIIEILLWVNELSLLRCQSVCKLFRIVIKDSIDIQYKIALFLALKIDGPTSSLGTSARLQLLKEHEARWETLRWGRRDTFQMVMGSAVWELAGGVFAQATGPQGIRFRRMPSILRKTDSSMWELDNLGVEIRDFGMSPVDDLLVLIERLRPSPTRQDIRLHLRTMITGSPHPLASSTRLDHSFTSGSGISSYDIQIFGTSLAILVRTNNPDDVRLLIWDWKTGKLHVCLTAEPAISIDSYTLLSNSHVLVGSCDDMPDAPSDPSLGVYEFRQSLGPRLLCRFTFPELVPLHASAALELHAEPIPIYQPSHPDLPFFTNSTSRICVLNITIVNGRLSQSTVLFRLQDLLDLALSQTYERAVIPWEGWSECTRWFDGAMPGTSWVIYMFGSRLIMPSGAHPNPPQITAVDLNRWTTLRKSPAPGMVQDIHKSSVYISEHFEAEITTSLPYRTCATATPKRYHALMIDEEHIYGILSAEREIDVYTF